MAIETMFHACGKLSPPVLSVYVNTSDQDATRHPRVRPELAWFREMAAAVRRDHLRGRTSLRCAPGFLPHA